MRLLLLSSTLCCALAVAATARQDLVNRTVETPGASTVTAEIWVDNWYALHVNGKKIAEDSIAYRTERSFNADRITFKADLPATVAIELRDFMENDTGLEYIGTRRQQMGDGGAIFQFLGEDGAVLGTSGTDWRCEVVHRAPLDTACAKERRAALGQGSCEAQITEAPQGWTEPGFDDGAWEKAATHSERAVRPKDGYDQVSWSRDADIIWSGGLVQDNIVLCRGTIGN